MENKKQIVLDAIVQQGMLPLFYLDSEQGTVDLVKTLYQAGVRVFEYTNRGAFALRNFAKLVQVRDAEWPGLYLGIGTITNAQQAQDFVAVGADFLVAPTVNPAVAEVAKQAGLLWIPGCMTPTEISLAQANQAGLIKLFPANILGPEFLSSIRDLFSGQLFMPTGGVEIQEENIASWFDAGVCAVGMGSKLVSKTIMEQQDYQTLSSLTTKAFAIIHQIKRK